MYTMQYNRLLKFCKRTIHRFVYYIEVFNMYCVSENTSPQIVIDLELKM